MVDTTGAMVAINQPCPSLPGFYIWILLPRILWKIVYLFCFGQGLGPFLKSLWPHYGWLHWMSGIIPLFKGASIFTPLSEQGLWEGGSLSVRAPLSKLDHYGQEPVMGTFSMGSRQ